MPAEDDQLIENEFASVTVSLDHDGNDVRLRVRDNNTGRTAFFDALTLEMLVWTPPDDLQPLLDPGRHRWRGTGLR